MQNANNVLISASIGINKIEFLKSVQIFASLLNAL